MQLSDNKAAWERYRMQYIQGMAAMNAHQYEDKEQEALKSRGLYTQGMARGINLCLLLDHNKEQEAMNNWKQWYNQQREWPESD